MQLVRQAATSYVLATTSAKLPAPPMTLASIHTAHKARSRA